MPCLTKHLPSISCSKEACNLNKMIAPPSSLKKNNPLTGRIAWKDQQLQAWLVRFLHVSWIRTVIDYLQSVNMETTIRLGLGPILPFSLWLKKVAHHNIFTYLYARFVQLPAKKSQRKALLLLSYTLQALNQCPKHHVLRGRSMRSFECKPFTRNGCMCSLAGWNFRRSDPYHNHAHKRLYCPFLQYYAPIMCLLVGFCASNQ